MPLRTLQIKRYWHFDVYLDGMVICPLISYDAQHAIANIILRLIGPTNPKEVESYLTNTLRNTLCPLSLKKPAPWRYKPIPDELPNDQDLLQVDGPPSCPTP